jgi:hypothetical protein
MLRRGNSQRGQKSKSKLGAEHDDSVRLCCVVLGSGGRLLIKITKPFHFQDVTVSWLMHGTALQPIALRTIIREEDASCQCSTVVEQQLNNMCDCKYYSQQLYSILHCCFDAPPIRKQLEAIL